MYIGRRLALVPFILFVVAVHAVRAGDWPQFRGPDARGTSSEAGVFESPTGVGLQVAWRMPLGSGYSGISVAGGRVVTLFTDGTSDIVVAFDAATGREIWRRAMGPTEAGHDGSHDGPLSTPLILGDRVVGLTGAGRLFAVRSEDGLPLWSVDLVERHGASKPFYGFTTSPILAAGRIVLQIGGEGSAVVAFDPRNGEKAWSVGTDTVQYQSPLLLREDGRDLLLAAGDTRLLAIDPVRGELLWDFAHEGGGGGYGAPSLTPVAAGDRMLFLAHKDEASRVVRTPAPGAGGAVEPSWENSAIRGSYNVPVYHDGHIYAFSSRFLTCVDAATGETRWRSREPGDGFLALADGHLIVMTKEGGLHIVAADPAGYREVAGLDVFEDLVWSGPAFAAGHIFARSLGEIARIDIRAGRTLRAAPLPGAEVAGTAFGRFLETLKEAPDKTAAIDRYLESQARFPIVEGDRAIFVYRGDARDVAVAGDPFGLSQERAMVREPGTDLFWSALRLDPDARVSYRFIRDYEEILDPRNPRRTEASHLGRDMEFSFSGDGTPMSWFSMPAWQAPTWLGEPPPERRGRVERRELASAVLGAPLGLEVYLPAGYDAGAQTYPVLFVHGGEGALRHGLWATALDNLIGNRVEPIVVVFIPRAGVAVPKYVEMFVNDLVPFVDAQYRTRPEGASRGNVGMGFGAIAAFSCTFSSPGTVGKLGTQSAFLTEFAWDPLQPSIKTADDQPLTIYLDWGKWDMHNPVENWHLAQVNNDVAAYLRQRGYEPAGGEVHDGSGWPSWSTRTDKLLVALFPLPR